MEKGMDLYPTLANNYALVRQHGNSIIFPLGSENEGQYLTPQYEYVTLNRAAAEILSFCDGNHTIAEIILNLCSIYSENSCDISNFVQDFLQESIEKGHVLLHTRKPNYVPKIFGNFSMITPINACLEITKQCPLRCRHCYNESGIARTQEMCLSEIKVVLDKLSNLGVQKLMITGGEPTSRPDFIDIVEYASSRFVGVSIASNGYLITRELARALSRYKNKIVVQISIDGTEEHHNKIRCIHDSYEKALAAIKYMSEFNIPVIAANTLNAENFADMEEVAATVHKAGALQLTFGLTASQGRARKTHLSQRIDAEQFVNRALALKHKYMNHGLFVSIDDDTMSKIASTHSSYCGAGVSQITIRENGDVSPCVCFFYVYGNILRDDIASIFDPKKVSRFSSLPSPSLEYCGDCEELENCSNCPAHAFDSPKETCKWRENFYNVMNEGK
jgi:MoaA/NifB/PqqE/SkfB family radical SAM enzyme